MRKYIIFFIFFFTFSCSPNKGVYWCGDHPCINKKEKEAYFKKTMIVEVREYDKKKMKKDSEIEKLLKQAKIDEKNRILSEKELLKRSKLEEKEFSKQLKIEEKKRKKEEKEMLKRSKNEEKNTKKMVKLKKKKTLNAKIANTKIEIPSEEFDQLVEKIKRRNSARSYPEINDIPK